MTHTTFISTWIALLAMALPAVAATGHDAIMPEQIAAAISGAGVPVSAKQVTLLTEVLARTNSPALRVQSMEPLSDHRMKVRLNCFNVAECVPFYVTIRTSGEGPAQPSPVASAQLQLPPPRPTPRKTEADSPVLRTGSSATLLLEGDHMSIQLPVVCLESGAIGQTIRVASKDRRQTYTARVFDGGTLRGKL